MMTESCLNNFTTLQYLPKLREALMLRHLEDFLSFLRFLRLAYVETSRGQTKVS